MQVQSYVYLTYAIYLFIYLNSDLFVTSFDMIWTEHEEQAILVESKIKRR